MGGVAGEPSDQFEVLKSVSQITPQVIRSAAPQAVIVGNAGPSVGNFLRQYIDSGAKTQFYGLSVSNVEQIYKVLGADSKNVIVAQVMPSIDSSTMPVVQDYRKAVKKAGTVAASGFGLEGYISARVIVDGFRRAGRDLTRQKFVAAMEGMGVTNVGGFPLRYVRSDHGGSQWVGIAIINEKGKLTY